MSYTKGPWISYERGEPVGYARYEIHYGEIGECVAEVVHEEADAKLISAAPDLYEALKDIVDSIATHGWEKQISGVQILKRNAIAALKKAEL